MHLSKHFLYSSVCLYLSLSTLACTDSTEKNREKILGDWELVRGFRNNKETESLVGTTFHFGENGKMETNLPVGIESPTDFEVNKEIISQIGRFTVKYQIKLVNDSMLTLGLEMRGTDFEMVMHRYTPSLDSLPAKID